MSTPRNTKAVRYRAAYLSCKNRWRPFTFSRLLWPCKCWPNARQATMSWGPTRRTLLGSPPHEAFALAFRPRERLLHRFAPRVAETHLGHRRLRVDLLRNVWWGWPSRDCQLLMVVGVRVMIECAVCTENLIRVDDVMESPKLAE